jgi:hypothetical protein
LPRRLLVARRDDAVALLTGPGPEGRISHLKRRYGLARSRVKGQDGQRIWTGWAILAYDLDTLVVHTAETIPGCSNPSANQPAETAARTPERPFHRPASSVHPAEVASAPFR